MSENVDDPDRDAFVKRQYGHGTRWFAYGMNEGPISNNTLADLPELQKARCDTIACPARFAHEEHGVVDDPHTDSLLMAFANEYDRQIGSMAFPHETVDDIESAMYSESFISEEQAKKGWLRAFAAVKAGDSSEVDRDETTPALRRARRVARSLGWLDEDETVNPAHYDYE